MLKKRTPPVEGAAPPRRRIVLIVGAVALAVAVLGGGLFALNGGAGLRSMLGLNGDSDVTTTMTEGEDPAPRSVDLVVMPFDEMIVNIAASTESGLRTSRFMRLDLALVYDRTKDTSGLVETRHIYMRDAFQEYLRQLTDRDIEGTHGLVSMRSELLRRARAIAGSNAPHEVLVMELVVQ